MTKIFCDRCSHAIPEGRVNKIEIRLNGQVQGSAELCLECKEALRDFLQPLPVAAPQEEKTIAELAPSLVTRG